MRTVAIVVALCALAACATAQAPTPLGGPEVAPPSAVPETPVATIAMQDSTPAPDTLADRVKELESLALDQGIVFNHDVVRLLSALNFLNKDGKTTLTGPLVQANAVAQTYNGACAAKFAMCKVEAAPVADYFGNDEVEEADDDEEDDVEDVRARLFYAARAQQRCLSEDWDSVPKPCVESVFALARVVRQQGEKLDVAVTEHLLRPHAGTMAACGPDMAYYCGIKTAGVADPISLEGDSDVASPLPEDVDELVDESVEDEEEDDEEDGASGSSRRLLRSKHGKKHGKKHSKKHDKKHDKKASKKHGHKHFREHLHGIKQKMRVLKKMHARKHHRGLHSRHGGHHGPHHGGPHHGGPHHGGPHHGGPHHGPHGKHRNQRHHDMADAPPMHEATSVMEVAQCLRHNWHDLEDSCQDAADRDIHTPNSNLKAALALARDDDYDDDGDEWEMVAAFILFHVAGALPFIAFLAVAVCCCRGCRRRCRRRRARGRGCCRRRAGCGRHGDVVTATPVTGGVVIGQAVQLVDPPAATAPSSDDEGVMYIPQAPGNQTQRLTRV